MLKTHSVRASQTCLQTKKQTYRQTNETDQHTCDPQRGFASNKQTDNFGRLTYLQSSQEDSQVTIRASK